LKSGVSNKISTIFSEVIILRNVYLVGPMPWAWSVSASGNPEFEPIAGMIAVSVANLYFSRDREIVKCLSNFL